MRTNHRLSLVFAAVAVLVLVMAVSTHALGAPETTTPEIEEMRAEFEQVEAELDRLNDDLSLQVEEYNAISEALEQTREAIAEAEAELVLARQQVADAQETLDARVEQMYRDGGASTLEVLLGTRSFEDFLVRLEWLQRISSQDARVVSQVRAARRRVVELKRTLEQREAEQVALHDEAASKKAGIERSIERRGDYAASLDDEIKQLIAEEEERQRKLAEERARQAAEAARRAAEAAAGSGGGSEREGSIDFPAPDPGAGPGRPEIVAAALDYLGVPYVWGGSTPSGFDCSGLTQYVYREIGISIPRTSRSQFRAGTHIDEADLDQLVYGDLVFFGYDGDPGRVHHVGIYCGDGNYIHAPYTGEVVKVSSLAERIATKGDYVGASRF